MGSHPDAALVMPVNWWLTASSSDQYDSRHAMSSGRWRRFSRVKSRSGQPRSMRRPMAASFCRRSACFIRACRTISAGASRIRSIPAASRSRSQARASISATLPRQRSCRDSGVEGRAREPQSLRRARRRKCRGRCGRSRLRRERADLVYSANGDEVGRIDVPERPLQILFGGANGQTLFILTHHSLYSVNVGQVGS